MNLNLKQLYQLSTAAKRQNTYVSLTCPWLSSTPGQVHFWELASRQTPSPLPDQMQPHTWSRATTLPLSQSNCMEITLAVWNCSKAKFGWRGSGRLVLRNSFRQLLPDWQIDNGWVWPLLASSRPGTCPAYTGLHAGMLPLGSRSWKECRILCYI